MPRVLITARIYGYLSDAGFEFFRKRGIDVVSNPYRGKGLTEAQLLELTGGVDGLLTGVDRVTRKVIEAADRLKVISKFGTGVDNIDVQAATERGIIVTSAPGANSESVADMTFALILAVARNLPSAFNRVRGGEWPLMVGTEVYGKSLGLIGLGEIGRRVARRASAFSMNILAHDVFPDEEFIRERRITLVPLETLLQESDFVSVHVPLTENTKHLIGRKELEMMRPSAFLINTARGGIVDEDALYEALGSGRIAGAGFDVLESEPPADRRLLRLDNFILTPHISPFTKEAIARVEQVSAQNIVDVLEGRTPSCIVNPAVLDRRTEES
jgi:D-3-phosphoglycerate dehydrogenase